MAVDTREKRASGLSVAGPYLVQLPIADGSVDTADRPQGLWAYSGITISAPVVSKSGTHATKLGEHGYMKRPRTGAFTKDPNVGKYDCAHLSLICDREVTLNAAIDSDYVALSTPIEATVTLEALICTRSVTITSTIDDDAVAIETTIGC